MLKKRHTNRQRLFQELKYGEGSYIRNVSYFFNKKYLTLLGLKTDKKNFHSIRHTVIDHLKQKLVDISFINELVGHHHGNIDLDRYGKGYTTDIIYNKCVKKINYETSYTRGIDFHSLKMDWKKKYLIVFGNCCHMKELYFTSPYRRSLRTVRLEYVQVKNCLLYTSDAADE